jgi:hypothetical protein
MGYLRENDVAAKEHTCPAFYSDGARHFSITFS